MRNRLSSFRVRLGLRPSLGSVLVQILLYIFCHKWSRYSLFFKVIAYKAFVFNLGFPFKSLWVNLNDPSPNKLPIKGSIISLENGIIGFISSWLGDLNLPLLSLNI